MRPPLPSQGRPRARIAVGAAGARSLVYPAALASLLAAAACSFLLDKSTTACRYDSDCERFGVHPSCQNGACVDSRIPCFYGDAATQAQMENACVPGTCGSFDDCQLLGVCGGGGLPALVSPDPPTAPPPPVPDSGLTVLLADAGPSAPALMPDGGPYPLCASLTGGAYVPVITGSSNFPTLLDAMLKVIASGAAQLPPGPAFIWQQTSSCQAATAVWVDDATTSYIHDPQPGSANGSLYAQYYSMGTKTPCLLGPGGMKVTIGESDVYSTTCNPDYALNGPITDHAGPNQAMAFVVPSQSKASAISHDAAYEVFGLGGNGLSTIPWTNPSRFYIRSKSTGTQQMIAKEIDVPADAFWGVDQRTASNVDFGLSTGLSGAELDQAIGILSVSVYDADRPNLKALAYRRSDQTCAYLPDSTIDSKDKANVRDGHYPIWGPLHFFTSSVTTNQEAMDLGSSPSLALVAFFAGDTVNPLVLDPFIDSGVVPRCAMSVTQSENKELGALAPFTPKNSCACYYVNRTGSTLPPECVACDPKTAATDCPASRPACNDGFCEVQ